MTTQQLQQIENAQRQIQAAKEAVDSIDNGSNISVDDVNISGDFTLS
jgi:hypothetical protein